MDVPVTRLDGIRGFGLGTDLFLLFFPVTVILLFSSVVSKDPGTLCLEPNP